MRNYTRGERRNLARQFGLAKKNESRNAWYARITRGIQAGKQIHLNHITEVENQLRNDATEREALQIKSLTEKYGEDEAKAIVAHNRGVEEARELKLSERRAKQQAKFDSKK